MAAIQPPGVPTKAQERIAPMRELQQSFLLLALTVSSLGAYIGVGFLVVRLFANR